MPRRMIKGDSGERERGPAFTAKAGRRNASLKRMGLKKKHEKKGPGARGNAGRKRG